MKDPRCMVGMHAYPKPDKDHPVSASQVSDGRLTLECRRCHATKRVNWRQGPPPKDVNPPMGGSGA